MMSDLRTTTLIESSNGIDAFHIGTSKLHPVDQVAALQDHRALFVTTHRAEVLDLDIPYASARVLLWVTTKMSRYSQRDRFLH